MSKIYLNPEKFQTQIDNLETANEAVSAFSYGKDCADVSLPSVDKLIECIDEMNQTMKAFYELTQKDIFNLKAMKADWMNADSEIATKTFMENITE